MNMSTLDCFMYISLYYIFSKIEQRGSQKLSFPGEQQMLQDFQLHFWSTLRANYVMQVRPISILDLPAMTHKAEKY